MNTLIYVAMVLLWIASLVFAYLAGRRRGYLEAVDRWIALMSK